LGLAWPVTAQAQAVNSRTTPNLRVQTLRAYAPHRNPERGAVKLDALRSIGANLPNLPLNRYLSIFVSDVNTMKQIKFSEVMDQLVKQSGDPFLTKNILFHQWWDSAGQRPGLGLGPHCDDESPAAPASGIANDTALSTLNSLAYRCPRLEVAEATGTPFADESDANVNAYSAIAFSNRLDLIGAPQPVPNSSQTRSPDCGEYRIVFARNSGKLDPLNRNLIIFEARVPNPDPDDGLKGCRPILDFWHGLSDTSISAVDRGKKLHDFYLNGLPGQRVGPIVDIAHYTFGSGQIRTNQFMLNSDPTLNPAPVDWTLREFKALSANGTLAIVPDSVKTNPGNDLFKTGAVDVRVASLNQDFRAQMKNILGGAGPANGVDDVNSIGFVTTGEGVNSFESDEKDHNIGDIVAAFAAAGAENPTLSASIQQTLTLAGSNLTPLNVVNRLRTQTCAGCHQYSNNDHGLGGKAFWPDKSNGDPPAHPKMPFTQESERDFRPAAVGTGQRYAISSAVECFLDFREAFMTKALGLSPGTVGNNCPIK